MKKEGSERVDRDAFKREKERMAREREVIREMSGEYAEEEKTPAARDGKKEE